MDNILFIDACARENSRTRVLAKYLLGKFDGNITTLNLYDLPLAPVDQKTICRGLNVCRRHLRDRRPWLNGN